MECIDHHEERDSVFAVGILGPQHVLHRLRIHAGIPCHVRHEQNQRVDGIGISGNRVGDHHVHKAMRGDGRIPGIRLVDADRLSVAIDREVFRTRRESERRPAERRVGGIDDVEPVLRKLVRRNRLRIRRARAEVPRPVQRAEQQLDKVQCPARLETVRMRRYATHCVHGDRSADKLVMFSTVPIGPFRLDLDRFLERDMRHLQGDALDRRRVDAAFLGDIGGRISIVQVALRDQGHYRLDGPAVGRGVLAEQRGRDVRSHAARERVGCLVEYQGRAIRVAQKKSIAGLAGCLHHEPRGVAVPHQELPVELLVRQQDMHNRKRQETVGARADRDPLIGDCRISGLHGIDRDEFCAVPLELIQPDLDRIRRMVFSDTPKQEVLGVVPVRRAEFPKRESDRIQARRGHVDRTEAAMRSPVRCTELLRPQTGQRLHLVAPGKERELFRIAGANLRQSLGQKIECVIPLDLDEFTGAALRSGLAHQRFAQLRRRILLHDPGGAFGAKDTLVDRMIAVALDKPDPVVLERDFDAAPARTHVARRVLDLLLCVILELLMGAIAVSVRGHWAPCGESVRRQCVSLKSTSATSLSGRDAPSMPRRCSVLRANLQSAGPRGRSGVVSFRNIVPFERKHIHARIVTRLPISILNLKPNR